jgi:hypothetical protein
MTELCKNGIKEISMTKASFICKITNENCKYSRWCFCKDQFKMLYPYCEEECENFELNEIDKGIE